MAAPALPVLLAARQTHLALHARALQRVAGALAAIGPAEPGQSAASRAGAGERLLRGALANLDEELGGRGSRSAV